jgi:GAF domain-containing protein
MPYIPENSSAGRSGPYVEPSANLSRADLSMLLAAERRLAEALTRPAELLAVEESAALLEVDRAAIYLVDSEDPQLLRVVAGTGSLADQEGELLPVEGSFEGRVYRGTVPVRTDDLGSEPDAYQSRQNQRRGGPAVAVPLRLRNRSIGVMLAAREPGGPPFLERDADLLFEFSTPVSVGIASMRQVDASRQSREKVDSWHREQKLRRWLERYESLAMARVELVFRLEESGQLEWGGSTATLFGIASREFAPDVDKLLDQVASADVENVQIALQSLVDVGGPPSVSVNCGITLPDGSTRQTRLEAWKVRDRGEIEIVGALTPAERPEGAVEQLAPVGQGAEAIVRSLRHQINNPLAAVIGRAQLMIREDLVQREPMLRQSVETILFESERINRFVQQLQDPDAISRLSEPLPGEAAG